MTPLDGAIRPNSEGEKSAPFEPVRPRFKWIVRPRRANRKGVPGRRRRDCLRPRLVICTDH